MKARIISYMGEGEELQRKRLAWHNQQLDWLLERGLEVVVFDQGYRENWYRGDSTITYARYKGPLLRPGPARNPLLEDFYASDETWAVMADNDAVLLGEADHRTIFDLLPQVADNIYIFSPVDGAVRGYPWRLKPDFFSDFLVFERHVELKGSFWFFRKPPQPIWFQDFTVGEDGDFVFQAVMAGLGVFQCHNIGLHEFASQTSTLFDMETRKRAHAEVKAHFAATYPGMRYANGRLNKHEFITRFWQGPRGHTVEKGYRQPPMGR